jgi:hypothetical protein
MTTTMSKRTYVRRTEEERIHDLEEKLAQVKARLEAKQNKNSPVLREWVRVQRALKKFGQTALDSGRQDLALSAQAFSAGLERSVHTSGNDTSPRRRGRPSNIEDAL